MTVMPAEGHQLVEEVERLRAALSVREREAAAKERQLERYAADLRDTFKRERDQAEELRRSYTGKHAERVTAYGMEMARTLGLRMLETSELEFGFLLHDIGKVAIPDAILYKPGALTKDERALMSQHPVIGAQIVHGIEFLSSAVDVVRSHHERWDGGGYPDGLAGEEIPLPARVFAVADVLDALTSDRPYRSASTMRVARQMIVAESGRQFDPGVVDAFESIDDLTFQLIAAEVG
jgi:ribonuclease P protein subunit RPR2